LVAQVRPRLYIIEEKDSIAYHVGDVVAKELYPFMDSWKVDIPPKKLDLDHPFDFPPNFKISFRD
jgi:hypothetical protein